MRKKREGILQVQSPFYHEDGDMYDVYVEEVDGKLRFCDFGKTLMRLSYTFDIDTDNKRRIFQEMLSANRVEFDERTGNIYLDADVESGDLSAPFFQIAQAIAKVSRLDVLKREVIGTMFFDMLSEFISTDLSEFKPEFNVCPMHGREDLSVTCQFKLPSHPVFLYAVRGSAQSRLAAITFLEFQRAKLDFRGWVVHDDSESLPSNDRRRITSASDKQFVSLDDFRDRGALTLAREAA